MNDPTRSDEARHVAGLDGAGHLGESGRVAGSEETQRQGDARPAARRVKARGTGRRGPARPQRLGRVPHSRARSPAAGPRPADEARPSSAYCSGSGGEGASSIRSVPDWVFGNAMTSRMFV